MKEKFLHSKITIIKQNNKYIFQITDSKGRLIR